MSPEGKPEPPAAVGARRAGADVLIQLVGRVANLALGVAVTIVLVRSLGDERFGAWVAILSAVQLGAYFGDFGLSMVAVQRAAAEPAQERAWMGIMLRARVLLAVPATLISGAIAIALADDASTRIAAAVLSLTVLTAVAGSLEAVFQLRVRNEKAIAVLTANSLLWAAVVFGVAAAGGGLVAFAVGFLAVEVVTNGLLVLLALRMLRPDVRPDPERSRDLLRTGVAVGLGGLLTLAYVRIDALLVFELSGPRDAGLYGAAYRLLDQSQFIPAAVMTTLLPLMAAGGAADPARLQRLVQLAVDLLGFCSLAMLAFALTAAEPLMVLLFDEEFADAGAVLPILMAAYVLIAFGYVAGNLVVVLGLAKRFLRIALLALIVNVAANLALVPTYGFVAAAWVTLATEVLVLGLTVRLLSERMRRPSLARLGRCAVAAAAMAGAITGLREAGMGVIGLMVAGLAVYLVAAASLRALGLDELKALARKQPL